MLKVSFETTDSGLKVLLGKYSKITAHGLAETLKTFITSNFNLKRNVDGSQMRALDPQTIIYKRKLGSTSPAFPLILSGQLRGATSIIDLNENSSLVILDDKVRGDTTNSGILDYQKKYGRNPWGMGERGAQFLKKYVDNIVRAD